MTEVRIFNTNTRKLIVAEVPTDEAGPMETGDLAISGVPGTGAPQLLWFHHPENTNGHGLLPTKNVVDIIATAVGPVRVTFIDAANPVIFAAAEDLGIAGTEVDPIDLWPKKVRQALEEVRGFAAVALGLAREPQEAAQVSRNIPKVGVVRRPVAYRDIYGREVPAADQDVTARILYMGTLHPAFALTGAMALTAAAAVAGSVVHEATIPASPDELRIGHPSGVLPIRRRLSSEGSLISLGIQRTARRLIAGTAYVPVDA
jgi:2-methylaconitate cis-trans-isomerase PrpF